MDSQTEILNQCALGNKAFCSVVFFAKGFPGNTNVPVAAEIDGNYPRHSRTARAFAEEFLDSRRCLPAMLAACGG